MGPDWGLFTSTSDAHVWTEHHVMPPLSIDSYQYVIYAAGSAQMLVKFVKLLQR